MNRVFSRPLFVALAVAASATGCRSPICGAGTVQLEDNSGELHCVASATGERSCDAETTVFKNGLCVSKTICGPNTLPHLVPDPDDGEKTRVICISADRTDDCAALNPGPGEVSISGSLYEWESGQKSMRKVRFTAHDGTVFLTDRAAPALMEDTNSKGCYAFSRIPKSENSVLAVVVDDPAGEPDDLQLGGASLQVSATGDSGVYKLDLYFVRKTTIAAWSADSGTDYATLGAFVPCFCNSTASGPRNSLLNECHEPRVKDVELTRNGSAATSAKYLVNANTIHPALSRTTLQGCAVDVASGTIDMYTGNGPAMVNWNTMTGMSAPKAGIHDAAVFFSRFYRK